MSPTQTPTFPYPLFDADHPYETPDSLTKYLPKQCTDAVSPFYEDCVSDLNDLVGVDRVLFGSDFPHPEGLAPPTHFADTLVHLPVEDRAKIMGGNLTRLVTV